jgi:hypothetical protein
LGYYNIDNATGAIVSNEAIAKVLLESNILTITAMSNGQTTLTITADKSYNVTITVRDGANDNGWL